MPNSATHGVGAVRGRTIGDGSEIVLTVTASQTADPHVLNRRI